MHLQSEVSDCQTIHKRDLKDFIAYISVVGKKPVRVSKSFYAYHINGEVSIKEKKDFYSLMQEKGAEGGLIVGIPKWIEHKATLQIPEKNLWLVMLHDLSGFERQDNVLTFWEIRGDSLEFEFLHPTTFVSGIGAVMVEEAAFFDDDSMLIILHESGGDAGDAWGSFIFLHYKEPDIINEIYRKRYDISQGRSYTQLTYDLCKSTDNLVIKFTGKHFSPSDKKWPPNYAMTKIDSFFVNLSEIITQNASKAQIPLEILLKDTTKQESLKWCYSLHPRALQRYPSMQGIGPSEIKLWRSGLLMVDSNLYPFKKEKEKLYFRVDFDADSTRCEITFLDPKISFENFAEREKVESDSDVIAIDRAEKKITYRFDNDRRFFKFGRRRFSLCN